MAALAAHGLTLPVVPGTRHVTLAGAIASDIHGKNHHRDGAFAAHVVSLKLWTPAQGVARGDTRERTASSSTRRSAGMGLTGVILEATVRAEPLPAPWVSARIERTAGLEQTLELLGGEERFRYSVAWLDMLAPGPRMGRAVIGRADPPAAETDATRGRHRSSAYPEALCARAAHRDPARASPAGCCGIRRARVQRGSSGTPRPSGPRERPLALVPYFFPLDAIESWNRLYGPDGLLQYQFVIPIGEEAALRAELRADARAAAARVPRRVQALRQRVRRPAVVPARGLDARGRTCPRPRPAWRPTLDALDELVAGCGGRVYLTKDARLRPEAMRAMYPRLDSFERLRSRVDPERVLRSDLGRRLGLCGDGP